MLRPSRETVGYVATLAGCLAVAVVLAWTQLGSQIDNYAADFFLRLRPPRQGPTEAAILSIDDLTLQQSGGRRRLRSRLAEALGRVCAVGPKAVAVDLILADEGEADEDARLDAAFRACPNLVLGSDLTRSGWQDPIPRFRAIARAVGHVNADPDLDGVSRHLPLEKASGRDRRWALALEAYRLASGADSLLESPEDLEAGDLRIPAPRASGRLLRIRYFPPAADGSSAIPSVSIAKILESAHDAAAFRGKVVFVGVTAQSEVRDRLMTPYSYDAPMPGVEIHAHAYETMARRAFLVDAPDGAVVAACVLIAVIAGLIFRYLFGAPSYVAAIVLIALAHSAGILLLGSGIVFPFTAPAGTALTATIGAGAFRYLTMRRALRRAQAEKARYQQAIHFVAHEMRTPLTAIQGSSEIIGRYNLSEDKRREFAHMINTESKRLARMIRAFLDVERLSAGEMELTREPFACRDMVDTCVERARGVASQKKIRIAPPSVDDSTLLGDRELMEYAVYNLLSNAVKYSPPDTEIRVDAVAESGNVRLSVTDQGIGMDEKEVKQIFQKFYRTRKAEASGESGFGIGLSIVEQIVTHHGGMIEVASKPGAGSRFTLVLPAAISARQSG